jgi:hypothetical protein
MKESFEFEDNEAGLDNETSPEKIAFPKVAEEILNMAEKDQELRKRITPHRAFTEAEKIEWAELHDAQTERLRHIVSSIGWPTISKVGKKAAEDAWLIAQHADHDVAFQKECLAAMSAEKTEEVSPIDVAHLHDRICMNEGVPQFFGTQMIRNEYGEYGPYPIEQIETVDERRAEIGLGTLAEYKDEHAKKYSEDRTSLNHPSK